MSSFTSPLNVQITGHWVRPWWKLWLRKWKRLWIIIEEFEYHVGHKDSNAVITVPAGTKTDLASIPQAFWSLGLDPTGPYAKAAVIHDYLYGNQGFGIYSRKRCDEIFLEGMEVLEVSFPSRRVIYRHVRWWGWIAWRASRRKAGK